MAAVVGVATAGTAALACEHTGRVPGQPFGTVEEAGRGRDRRNYTGGGHATRPRGSSDRLQASSSPTLYIDMTAASRTLAVSQSDIK